MDNGWLCGDMETIRWLQIHKMSSPTAVFWVSDNQSTNHTAQVLDICRRGNRSIPRDQERDPNFSIKDIHFPFHIVEAFPFSLCVCAYAIQPTRLLSSIYRVKYSMVLQPAAWEVESISCLTLADTHITLFTLSFSAVLYAFLFAGNARPSSDYTTISYPLTLCSDKRPSH
jgi:hypothetical protein